MTLFANVVADSSSDVSSDCLENKFWSSSPSRNRSNRRKVDKNDEEEAEEEEEEDCFINAAAGRAASTSTITRRHTTTVVAIADEPSNTTNSSTSYEYTIEKPPSTSNSNSQQPQAQQRPHPLQVQTTTDLTVLNHTTNTPTDSTKRYQTKMLLASLIEHFCRAYGDTPDANRKVFFLICQTLRSLGIIDAEFVDEMTSVRSSFQQAFHKLFYTAVQTVRNQDLVSFDDNLPRLIKPAKEEEEETSEEYTLTSSESSSSSSSSTSDDDDEEEEEKEYFQRQQQQQPRTVKKKSRDEVDYFSSSHNSNANTNNNNLSSLSPSKLSAASSNTLYSLHQQGDFFHNLSVQNSRYNNDFVEINLLGKGGFASAFRARNKLDGIDYAVKKIRLGNDIEDEGERENPYEKIFREIKNLARLEHVNVIRYYSSWLEYDESNHLVQDSDLDEESYVNSIRPQTWTRRRKSSNSIYYSTGGEGEESSVFDGRDPTFDDDEDTSSLGMYPPPSESGMSHIQFGSGGNSSSGAYAGGNDSSSMSHNTSKSSSMLFKKPIGALPQQSGWTLFIQMQLCPTTLHDYIKFRNKQYAETLSNDTSLVDTKRNIEIFSQILQGTAYIHDQGLIHRDLKPSNIFLSMSPNTSQHHHDSRRRKRAGSVSSSGSSPHDAISSGSFDESGGGFCMWEEAWVPKIGDFGLAAEAMDDPNNENNGVLIPTPITSLPPSPVKSSFSNSMTATDDNTNTMAVVNLFNGNGKPKRPKPRRTRTIGVGTRTYASPEQLAIPAQPYDEKVDIYSLGIILFELFQPFATGMERADSLEKLKQGVFPQGFLELYPKVSALIIWMMDNKPDHRPTAHQLLEFELFSHPVQEDDMYHLSLQQQLQSKTNVIDELKKRVEQVESEKREMQLKMDEMQRQLDSLLMAKNSKEEESNANGIKKCIFTPSSPLPFKRKKEVRWSTLNAE